NQFNLIVTVTDNGSPQLSTSAPIRIDVKAPNGDTPVVATRGNPTDNFVGTNNFQNNQSPGDGKGANVTFNFPENTTSTVPVATVTVTDADLAGAVGSQGLDFIIVSPANGGLPDGNLFKFQNTNANSSQLFFENTGNNATVNAPSAVSPTD